MDAPTRVQAVFRCAAFVVAAAASIGIAIAAIVVPAPPAVAPLIAVTCVVCPLWAIRGVRDALLLIWTGARERAVLQLRRHLDRLPETDHPLGM